MKKYILPLLLALSLLLPLAACQSPASSKDAPLVATKEGIARFVPSAAQSELLAAYAVQEDPLFLFKAPASANWVQFSATTYSKDRGWKTEDHSGFGNRPDENGFTSYFSLIDDGFATWTMHTSGGSSTIRPLGIPPAAESAGFMSTTLGARVDITLDTPITLVTFVGNDDGIRTPDASDILANPEKYEDMDYVCVVTATFSHKEPGA